MSKKQVAPATRYEKQIIHINKSFSEVETNLNSKIVYNLKDPIHLREGDTVSLIKAMVGQRGLTGDTISFTEEQTITLKGHIYTQANSRLYSSEDGNMGKDGHVVREFGYYPDRVGPEDPNFPIAIQVKDYEQDQPPNDPIFLIRIIPVWNKTPPESDPDNYNFFMVPETFSKTVIINPGNYTVASLSNIIELQLNGQETTNNTFKNFQLDLQNENLGFAGNFFDNQWLIGKSTYDSVFPMREFPYIKESFLTLGAFLCKFASAAPGGVPALFPPVEGYCFIDGVTFNKIIKVGVEDGLLLDINDFVSVEPFYSLNEQRVAYYGLTQGQLGQQKGGGAQLDATFQMKENIYGASEVQVIYDTETINRFSIANLHTPLKMPNYSDNDTKNPDAGQQMTKYPCKIRNGPDNFNQRGFYPLECSSGFCALSFDYEMVKTTDTYKLNEYVLNEDINIIINDVEKTKSFFKLNTFRHFEYYPETNNIMPSNLFSGSFWDRLGFGINQLYNFNSKIEVYQHLKPTDLITLTPYSMRGIITHNDSGYSLATSAGGLGVGIPMTDGTMFQPFSTFGIMPTNPGNAFADGPGKQFNILSTSKYITAENYPDLLGGKNYYIIKSNIIQNNYFDVKSNKSSIIGLINFNFVSNDTIFTTESMEFSITQDRILNEIIIELTNPDGSPASEFLLTQDSGFLLQIVRNITPELEIQEFVNQNDAK